VRTTTAYIDASEHERQYSLIAVMLFAVCVLLRLCAEDYQGPSSSGFFKWMPDENGQMRPVTRMKEKTLDKPGMWDKVYSDNDD